MDDEKSAGRTGFVTRVERLTPAWLAQHALGVGWCWVAVWLLLLLPAELASAPGWVWAGIIVFATLPALSASFICLGGTPYSRLRHHETVLSHFFGRFAGFALGFVLWTASVVLSASIAAELQEVADGGAIPVSTGLEVLFGALPFALGVIWFSLLLRYAWLLARLRGWRAHPARSKLPSRLLGRTPRLRTSVIALAHPGLLLVAGLLSTVLTLALALG